MSDGLVWNPAPKAVATAGRIDAGSRCAPAAEVFTVAHVAEDWRPNDGHWPRQTLCGLPFLAGQLWQPCDDAAPTCPACADRAPIELSLFDQPEGDR